MQPPPQKVMVLDKPTLTYTQHCSASAWAFDISHISFLQQMQPAVVDTCLLWFSRQDAAVLTRKRLEEAAERRAQEDRDKAAHRHQRQEYK